MINLQSVKCVKALHQSQFIKGSAPINNLISSLSVAKPLRSFRKTKDSIFPLSFILH